jgi:hypothetical protein
MAKELNHEVESILIKPTEQVSDGGNYIHPHSTNVEQRGGSLRRQNI